MSPIALLYLCAEVSPSQITFENGCATRLYEGCWMRIVAGCQVWMLGVAGTNLNISRILEGCFSDHKRR
jgi:hypothetical protein